MFHRPIHVLFGHSNWAVKTADCFAIKRKWHKFWYRHQVYMQKIWRKKRSEKKVRECERANRTCISSLINTFPKVNIHLHIACVISFWRCHLCLLLYRSLCDWNMMLFFLLAVQTIVQYDFCIVHQHSFHALLKCVCVWAHTFFVFIPNKLFSLFWFICSTWIDSNVRARPPIELYSTLCGNIMWNANAMISSYAHSLTNMYTCIRACTPRRTDGILGPWIWRSIRFIWLECCTPGPF